MAKRTSKYANMNAGDLARETRAKGLQKPNVLTLSEWADWLEDDDKRRQSVGEPVSDADAARQPFAEIAPDYDAMSKAEAVKRAQEAGMPVTAKTSKVEAVDWLLAAAGVSEDEQAAMDADDAAKTAAGAPEAGGVGA